MLVLATVLILVLVGPWCWGHRRQAGIAGTIVVVIVLVLVSGAIVVVIALGDGAALAVVVMVVVVGPLSSSC